MSAVTGDSVSTADISSQAAMRLSSRVDLRKAFGSVIFKLEDVGQTGPCCGICCKHEYDDAAEFFDSVITVNSAAKHTICCCCELPWIRSVETIQKYRVLDVSFADSLHIPWCFVCCPWVCIGCCKCCFPFRTVANLAIMNQYGRRENRSLYCQSKDKIKAQAVTWVYSGIMEKADSYHLLAHLQEGALVAPSILDVNQESRKTGTKMKVQQI